MASERRLPAPAADALVRLVEPFARADVPAPDTTPRRARAHRLEDARTELVHLAGDAVALVAAVAVTHAGAGAQQGSGVSLLWLYPLAVLGLLAQRGAYRRRIAPRWLDDAGEVAYAATLGALALGAAAFLASAPLSRASLVVAWAVALTAGVAARGAMAVAERRALVAERTGSPTLIVGSGHVAAQVERRLHDHPELGLRPIGFVDDEASAMSVDGRRPLLGGLGDLPDVVRAFGVRDVIVAFMGARGSDAAVREMLCECTRLGVRVSVVPRLFEAFTPTAAVADLGALPVITLEPRDPSSWRFAAKHAVDRAAAALMLVLLAPLLAVIALAVRLSSPGPVLLRQERVGQDGRTFGLLKFRSMRVAPAAPAPATPLAIAGDVAPGGVEGEDRRTRVGRILRRTSLDELAQLVNVLKGEMSLIGPRPERPDYVETFERVIPRYGDRHRVRPGITGWAQVNGLRGKTSLRDRVEWDNFYIENCGPRLELRILLLTIAAVLRSAE